MWSKLNLEIKKYLISYVDKECNRTIRQLSDLRVKTFDTCVLLIYMCFMIDMVLRKFHYALKGVTLAPLQRKHDSTIEFSKLYSVTFMEYEDKILFFRRNWFFCRHKTRQGHVTTILAATNKYRMIFHKISFKNFHKNNIQYLLWTMPEYIISVVWKMTPKFLVWLNDISCSFHFQYGKILKQEKEQEIIWSLKF